MNQVAPNLQALIGDLVGARLISHAGSLTNLAKYPASTVQILGAEKALFRALKTKGKTPKYGLIFHSSFIGRAGAKNKGRISRYLANKCSIASRIDCFSDVPTDLFGKKLHEQVEDRLKFYETGEAPMKNADAMQEVLDEFEALQKAEIKSEKKKKAGEAATNGVTEEVAEVMEVDEEKPKKKKKRKSEAVEEEAAPVPVPEEEPAAEVKSAKKKKKKSKVNDENDASVLDESTLSNGKHDDTMETSEGAATDANTTIDELP